GRGLEDAEGESTTCIVITEVHGRSLVLSGGYRTLHLWDPATGRRHGRPLTAHDGWLWDVVTLDVDGRRTAVSSSGDGRVLVWDLDHEPAPFVDVPKDLHSLTTATVGGRAVAFAGGAKRSEEHTSELQSRENLVCRLLLE